MLIYRSIGIMELLVLLNDKTVNGRYNNSTEKQNDSTDDNIVCFFTAPYRWQDKNHRFHIILDIKENDKRIVGKGKGIYFAAKNFAETKVWTGRKGSVEYFLPEIYLSNYSASDIISIDGIQTFASHFIKSNIEPFLNKYKIKAETVQKSA